jgi:hypothetical protein
VIFFDESRFGLTPDNKWRRIKRGCLSDSRFVEKKKFVQSVQFWGTIGNCLWSKFVKTSNHENASEYIQIVSNSRIIDSANQLHGEFQ